MSLSLLVQKFYRLQFPRHSIFDDLWWPQYWPDQKICYGKVVDLWQTYPTPFAACRSDAWFSRSDGGGGRIASPPCPESILSEPARNSINFKYPLGSARKTHESNIFNLHWFTYEHVQKRLTVSPIFIAMFKEKWLLQSPSSTDNQRSLFIFYKAHIFFHLYTKSKRHWIL